MPPDAHEGTELGVDPDVNDLVATGRTLGFVDAKFVARLAADILGGFQFGIRPVEESQGEVLVGEVSASDGLDDLFRWKFNGFAVRDFKKIEGTIGHPHVENTQGAFVFSELELDVFALEEKCDRDISTLFLEVSGKALVQLGEGGSEARPFQNLLGGRLLCLRGEAGDP